MSRGSVGEGGGGSLGGRALCGEGKGWTKWQDSKGDLWEWNVAGARGGGVMWRGRKRY